MATKRGQNKKTHKSVKNNTEKLSIDSVFLLKAVIFMILGSQWIYVQQSSNWQVPIPIGLIIGLVFATHDHFIMDRKIEYVILLFAAFVSFWLPLGLVINI